MRTTTGRCVPLAIPVDCQVEIPDSPPDFGALPRWMRPPLASRACCAGEAPGAGINFNEVAVVPPAPPPKVPRGINLRTNTGRCLPMAKPQDCRAGTLPDTGDATLVVRYTRPPLNSRTCCAGAQDNDPTVEYVVNIPTCEHIALEDGLGFFALENEQGTLLLECAEAP